MVESLGPAPCVNHPKRETGVRCAKCGDPICTSCMVQTPVGMRCRRCAQFKRLPQHDVGPLLLGRSMLFGLPVSIVTWLLVSLVPYFSFFLAILVGLGVGEVMSRSARRRSSRLLDVAAVLVVVIGLAVAEFILPRGGAGRFLAGVVYVPGYLIGALVPVIVASAVAVLKLR